MAKKKKNTLTPPDLKQCQAEKPNGYNFMTLGGRPGLERCTNKPMVIIHENKPGKDGLQGSMTLCDGCLAVFRQQMPRDYATVKDIDESRIEPSAEDDKDETEEEKQARLANRSGEDA